ncbi:hypothetical protein KL86DES1_21416 [uncultured Desulfovibrio sp.]|uniref:Uncharacterized protein n=1 Tax=uncultured Desulfovibrio sp. TaxID=167968 RepID=A0A212L7V4_9BACT|nr:hypothetical protein KL86DES1_21416 [uncultured Desulfovibrio sp.]VZH34313.1 conserved protein of unknown function [Desulfovibrio sp. 86]
MARPPEHSGRPFMAASNDFFARNVSFSYRLFFASGKARAAPEGNVSQKYGRPPPRWERRDFSAKMAVC